MKSFFFVIVVAGVTAQTNISGEIKTTETFQYGRFTTKMRSPKQYGTVAAFFTFWGGPDWQTGLWNELDIEVAPSVMLDALSPFSTNLIYGGGSGTDYNI